MGVSILLRFFISSNEALQTAFYLCLNVNIYHQDIIFKLPDFDGFSLCDIRK